MTAITRTENITFSLPAVSADKINAAAVAKVNQCLPELEQKTRAFDRNNSQHTLALMSLTMLNGQSPYRMMRQVMAEVEKRKMALAEAQVSHAKTIKEIQDLEGSIDPVEQAELRQKQVSLDMLESKINGAFKDIATLIDAYENIKAKNNIDDWDEEAYEREEKRHHVRRGFELMYRNLLDGGRAQTATIEYLQQYGVHPQVALTEVSGYIKYTADQIAKQVLPHSNDLEDFLDQMANKYCANVDKTSERLFGKTEFTNPEYMLRLEDKK
jgi:Tfp pilus assembly protein PilN